MHAGPIRINGLSVPSNQVRSLALAFNATLQLGDPDACQPCADTAAFVAEEFATVYTEAVEEAELEFQTNFGPLEVSIDTFVESIINASAPAFATVRNRCGACDVLPAGMPSVKQSKSEFTEPYPIGH